MVARNSYFQPLSWNLRMKVALGAAKGLAYLHGPEARVIYRDFKTSNILLDSDYNAKLPDFGLAKDGPKDGWLMGTHGYAAPEDIATSHLTAKSNIYSFGVVLLEMLTGKRAVDKNRPQGEHNLVEWAKPYLTSERKIFHIMDTHIEGQYSVSGALRAATLAMKCLDIESENRPQMDEVVKDLEKLQDLEDSGFAGHEGLGIHHSNPKVGLKNFVFSELRTATRNFRPDGVLGEGGFGIVFKGWIDEKTYTATKPGTGMVIAVKRLNQEGLLGRNEWLTEINYLGQLYHPNLLKLVGYCLEDEHRLLVYEFMPQGSLDNHLFRRNSDFQPLAWNLRMKVALGAAKGFAYLHSLEPRLIYRDFKTSNILLDSDYNAKLSDFGFAEYEPVDDMGYVPTKFVGTYVCAAAPEYIATGILTARSDVYHFGVVLLEMLTGKRAIDINRPQGEHNLVELAKPYLTSKRMIVRVMDARIKGQYSLRGALGVATLAIKCLSTEPKFRPTMDEVVTVLEQLQIQDLLGKQHSNPKHGLRQA